MYLRTRAIIIRRTRFKIKFHVKYYFIYVITVEELLFRCNLSLRNGKEGEE